jgi:hypothetical protein
MAIWMGQNRPGLIAVDKKKVHSHSRSPRKDAVAWTQTKQKPTNMKTQIVFWAFVSLAAINGIGSIILGGILYGLTAKKPKDPLDRS